MIAYSEPIPVTVIVDPVHQQINQLLLTRKYPTLTPILRQIYLDLKKVKLWEVLAVRENSALDVPYLVGQVKKKDRDVSDVILPVNSHATLTMRQIHATFEHLEGGTLRDMTFAVVDSDSSVTYYRLYNSIVPPTELRADVAVSSHTSNHSSEKRPAEARGSAEAKG